MKHNYKKPVKMTNAVDPATSTNRSWGHYPVPNKGGKTCNGEIFEKTKKKEDK